MNGEDPIAAPGEYSQEILTYLPRKHAAEYGRNEIIYDGPHRSMALAVVVNGRVKVTSKLEDGAELVMGIFGRNEFFGESGLLGHHADPREEASTLERTTLISWTATEVEAGIQRQPRLGMVLMQIAVRRCMEFSERLESLALDRIPARMARCLLHFASRVGQPQRDGTIRIPPLTHDIIAGYLGTSREMITLYMIQWRQQGLIRYSRKGIQIDPQALAEESKMRTRERRWAP